jgi:PAS domain-containing protein
MVSSVFPLIPSCAIDAQPNPRTLPFFKVLVDIMPVAAVVKDQWTGHCVLWNQAAEQRLGFSAQFALGQPLDKLFPPDSAVWGDCDRLTLPSTASENEPSNGSDDSEARSRYRLMIWPLNPDPIPVSEPSPVCAPTPTIDPELAAAQQTIERLQSELQQTQAQLLFQQENMPLLENMTEFAHKVANPVTVICGNLKYVTDYSQQLLEWVQLSQTQGNLSPEMQLASEAIDLEFLMQDLPKVLNSMRGGSERLLQILQSLNPIDREMDSE